MASFTKATAAGTKRHASIEAGFQNWGWNWDAGQWSGCQVGVGNKAGTNMSISACFLSSVRGYDVTRQEMENLTKAEALQLYKQYFWDAIGGDNLKSQRIAEFLFNMKSSAGGNAGKQMQKALNSFGESLAVDGAVGQLTQAAINRQVDAGNEAALYNKFRANMLSFYASLSEASHNYQNRVNSMDKWFPVMQSNEVGTGQNGGGGLMLSVFAGLTAFWLFFFGFGKDGK